MDITTARMFGFTVAPADWQLRFRVTFVLAAFKG